MYIDETGNSDLKISHDENNRFLGLTGIIVLENYARTVLKNAVDSFKMKYFNGNFSSVILHRKDIINKNGYFQILNEKAILDQFNRDLLQLLINHNFLVVTVVIDKLDHLNKYRVWRADPYHYCLEIIIERYFWLLSNNGGVGDIMFESRTKQQDKRLKKAYQYFYDNGTRYIYPEDLQAVFTSCEIKLKSKYANITGLQIADLLAHPSCQQLKELNLNIQMQPNFGARIVEILEQQKYYRSPSGKVEGYGRKWLP